MTSRALLPLVLLACLAFGGCMTERGRGYAPRYYRVLATNYRGQLIAEWIAHGYVRQTETGYRFRAVERHVAGPLPQDIRYPEGRMVEVGGPNITVARCREPEWLYLRWRTGIRTGVMEY